MIIAVIGDYASSKYKDFLKTVKTAKPEETILDLSRHTHKDWSKLKHAHFTDISNAHLVVLSADYKENFESRNDVHHAMSFEKEDFMYIYTDGKFRPFPEHATAI